MKNIHVLPTDKPSRLYLTKEGFYFLLPNIKGNDAKFQNIYITSDDEIKVGDWVIEFQKGDNIGEVHFINNEYVIAQDIQKKIILTTDQDLIKDGVQAIDDEFLEWFVKNPSCEEIKIIDEIIEDTSKDYIVGLGQPCTTVYKIIIPKEEPKQETLEEAYNKIYKEIDFSEFDFASFAIGVKYQQEKSYSEEEVLKSADYLGFKQITSEELNSLPYQPFITDEDGNIWVIDKEKWFEQFKKK
jgi:hypothetical protein